nr:hypothetical protein [Tanacetum cinerariifolium]
MDVKSAFLYGIIEEEVYVCQPPSFEDPHFPDKVYKVEKALCGLHQAPRAWYENLSTYLLENKFSRGTIDKTLFIKKDKDDILLVQVYVKQKDDGIFISQDKYVADILKKFDFTTVKTTSILMEPNNALIKDAKAEDFQVTLKSSHLYAVKRIFKYLKGQPKLGLWYPRDSPFDLEAFSDSDYAGASLDRKSTTGGCQFLGKRLISWQCKKQTVVANSTTKAEYVAAASCCGHMLWIQNQMLDYGFNLIKTKIYIDNESTICIVKNLVFHSETKHLKIRHHFIRDSYEKKLIQIRALVDRKKIIITKASIRRDLQLQDAKGTACLPNAAIFGELARIWILSLEQIKTNQTVEIEKPKKRVKKLEGKKKKRTHGLKRLYKVRLMVKNKREKDKIGTKPDKNRKRGEAGKVKSSFSQ